MRQSFLPVLLVIFFISSCIKESSNSNNGPNLVFKFKFDPTQARLNNLGQPQAMPAGHAGQSPTFNKMSAHYLELAPGALTEVEASRSFRERQRGFGPVRRATLSRV